MGDYVDSLLLGKDTEDSPRPEAPIPAPASEEALTTAVATVFEVQGASRIVTYSKGVQTDTWDEEETETEKVIDESALREQIRAELVQEIGTDKKKEEQHSDGQENAEASKVTIMESGEAARLVDTPEFQQFIGNAWRVVGRALDDDYNILTDYGASNADGEDTTADKTREIANFYSPDSTGRAVTSIDWSHQHPELLASAHTQVHGDPSAPKGLVQVWNMHGGRSAPEYKFTGQSDVLTVRFSQHDPRLLYGTAYNGQVLMWDLRAGAHPVLRSPLAGGGHLYPVYALEMAGSRNASTLVTSSTDGEVCMWPADVLAKPQDRLALTVPVKHTVTRREEELSATALALSPLDASLFHVGTESGRIYQCSRFAQASLRAGVDSRGVYAGHDAPVTALSVHPSSGPVSLGNYMLSSSADWSVKLWRVRQFGQPGAASNSGTVLPLAEFARDDAVYDVAWSPLLPGVFGDVDGSGYLDVWNLARDFDFPVLRLRPTARSLSENSSSYVKRPLNRLAWSRHDPYQVATGGLDGSVAVFQLDPAVLPSTQAEHWAQTKRTLLSLEE